MILKKLPKEYYLTAPVPKDNKKIFYIGTSDLISINKTDIFRTNYGIDTIINSNPDCKIYKIGVTKDLNTRLNYYKKEITDFRIIKSWEIENPMTLEEAIIGYYEKSDFDSFGREWFWDNINYFDKFLERIEWFIENTYTKVPKGYLKLFDRK